MQDWGPRGPQFESGSVYFSAFENKGINIETIFNYVYFEVITFVRRSIVCLFVFFFFCVCVRFTETVELIAMYMMLLKTA